MMVFELHSGFGKRLKALAGKIFLLAVALTVSTITTSQELNSVALNSGQPLVVETDQHITLRDGTVLSATIYRPAGSATYPALYAATPFPLGTGDTDNLPAELGPVSWYVEQGYAVVLVNVRGTGRSSGEYAFLSREEQQDHYEVIDWISSQPWSDQRVGGYGSGYSATVQWHMASQFSRNLQCIAPYGGATDPYSEWVMPGGVRNTAFINNWYETRVRDANAFLQDSAPAPIAYDLLQQTRLHPLRDTFWLQRSPLQQLSQINTPVFVIQSWDSLSAGTSLSALKALQINWKLLLLPAEAGTYSDVDFHSRVLLPYYDWCLKQQETGYTDQPAIRFTPENTQDEFSSTVWPPQQVRQTAWNLNHSTGENPGLMTESVERDMSEQLSGNTLRYRSAVLEQALSLTGPVMLELYFNTTSEDTAVEVTLLEEVQEIDINNPGALPSFRQTETQTAEPPALFSARYTRTIGKGVLRASLRASDSGADNHDPQYLFATPQLMVSGRPYRLDIALSDAGTVLAAGSRLLLEIRLKPDGTLPDNGGHQVLYGPRNPSRLWLPVNEEITPEITRSGNTKGTTTLSTRITDSVNGSTNVSGDPLFDGSSPFIVLPARSEPQNNSEAVQ